MKKKIFIIDDEPSFLYYAGSCLEDRNFEVHKFSDAESVLEALETIRPDAIILDVMLKGFSDDHQNGLKFAKKLKQLNPETFIIILTGLDRSVSQYEEEYLAPDMIFRKPCNFDNFFTFLDRLFDEK